MRSLREVARVLARGERAYSAKITDVMAASGTVPVRPGRKVTIYAQSKTPMQSGSAQTLAGEYLFKLNVITPPSAPIQHALTIPPQPRPAPQVAPPPGASPWRPRASGPTP